MPRIFDNIEQDFGSGLLEHIKKALRVDYCVGYFNIRGWNLVANEIDKLQGEKVKEKDQQVKRYCRLLVGMYKTPSEIIAETYSEDNEPITNKQIPVLTNQLKQELKQQLTIGSPTEKDEALIRKLLQQLKSGKVVIKLFLKHLLHAKLYLAYSQDTVAGTTALLGSSNFTLAGLKRQGELNVDVLDQDAAHKLSKWFDDRWNEKWCIDITKDVIQILEECWARETEIPPYYIYLKMAYHLSQEARNGIDSFQLSNIFQNKLLDFQQKAVLIGAHNLYKHGGLMIGDVVGLGKTITATAIAKLFEEDFYYNTLILPPKNLQSMWEEYVENYGLHAKVIPHSMITKELPTLKRYKLVIVDESHNFRNSENQSYKTLKSYIESNDCKVMLLSATPYNKSYSDLANQLQLFIPEHYDLGISPEKYIAKLGGTIRFQAKHTDIPLRSIKAFEKSEDADDWRELMKSFLIRRTRSFIKKYYSETDPKNNRKYVVFSNGERSYFPERLPKKVTFEMNSNNKLDQYALLYDTQTIDAIDRLYLSRYSLGLYLSPYLAKKKVTEKEAKIIEDLSRAGKRIKGFCRTNLYKRLESCGYAFVLSLRRLILKNYIFLYALENNLPLPIGGSNVEVDMYSDTDEDDLFSLSENIKNEEENIKGFTENDYIRVASSYYDYFAKKVQNKFRWLPADYFNVSKLISDIKDDNNSLLSISALVPEWESQNDRKISALQNLLTSQHPKEKALIFTQFADTANYITEELKKRGLKKVAVATGGSNDISTLAKRFSPLSNNADISDSEELRILVSTDVLSEGQNLQDAHIIINFDLPWAIIRLIQRAGRVDRLGQNSQQILCYSFLPEDGVEKIIKLRAKLTNRIKANAEVVGSDEVFFDGDPVNIEDLYNEKSGILDEQDGIDDVDLSSYAYQIWKNAIDINPDLKDIISALPNVVYSSKKAPENAEEGVIVYTKTQQNNDVLTQIDSKGNFVTQSQFTILKTAECSPEEPALPRFKRHHELVKEAVFKTEQEDNPIEGSLGRKNGIKYKTYMKVNRFILEKKETLYVTDDHKKALDELYRHNLREYAKDAIARQLKAGISDQDLADLLVSLNNEGRLCISENENTTKRLTQIICSMGLKNK